eukprot:10834820-Alexandrium_andersonii.AAC.1
MRSSALLWSAKTAAGQLSTDEGGRFSTNARTRGASSPRTCSYRPDAKSAGTGGQGRSSCASRPQQCWGRTCRPAPPPGSPRGALQASGPPCGQGRRRTGDEGRWESGAA